MKKRLLSMLMVVLMVFALLPAAAFAADKCEHVWQDVSIEMDAHAQTPGIDAKVCEKCGEVKDLKITPFKASKEQCDICKNPVTAMVQEAACGVVGLQVKYCGTCGSDMDLLSRAKGFKALSHKYDYTVTVEPTCTSDGWGYAVCSLCKEPVIIFNSQDAKDLGADKATVAKYAKVDHNPEMLTTDVDRDGDGVIIPNCDNGVDLKAPVKPLHPQTVEGFTKYVTTSENVAYGDVDSYFNDDETATTEVIESQSFDFYFESGTGIGYSGDKVCTMCGLVDTYGKWLPDLSQKHAASMRLIKEGYLPGIDPETGLKYDGRTDEYYCGDCNKTFGGKTIDFYKYFNINAEADTVTVGAYAATCTQPGYTGDVMTQIDKLDENGNPVKDENGNVVQVYILKHKGTEIEPLGHKWGALSDVEASCNHPGFKYSGGKQCTVCGVRDYDRVIYVPAQHNFSSVEWKHLVEATCTNRGIDCKVCNDCGYLAEPGYTSVVDHVASVVGAVDATCTEAGYTGDTVCKWCGEPMGKGEDVAPLGHKGELQNAKEATETEDGYTGDLVCTVCGEVLEKGTVIPKTGKDDPAPKPEFDDVAEDAYYAAPVAWAVDNGITKGIDDTHFAPNAICTRAQMVTFLWRAAGSPVVEDVENPFSDVKADAYYYDAVLWAVSTGVTKGTSATTFSPNATVTRAQVVTFLYRFDGEKAASAKNPFSDVAEGAYYYNAVLWAVENGVTTGMTATTFAPNNDCTRGQIVTFLYRFCNL